MNKNKQLEQLKELKEFVKNSKNYTSTKEVINNYEILIKKYDCFCITDPNIHKQYTEFYSELKNKILEKKINGGKRKTKILKYNNKKTRKNQKGGNMDLIYICAAIMVTAGIAVLTISSNSNSNSSSTPHQQVDYRPPHLSHLNNEESNRVFQSYINELREDSRLAHERDSDLALPEHERNNCSICYESLHNGDPTVKTRCNHSFHLDCLDNWRMNKNTCPICRAIL